MSVKLEPSGRRYIEVTVDVPGSVEEVWDAIATGPGVSAWFVPCEMDGREGGLVTCHFGPGMDSTKTITTWDPPRMFAAGGGDVAEGMPDMATEWHVESLAGGLCRVRVVHSLFASTDEWDDQLEAVENGWPTIFRILRIYLDHFRGERSARSQAMAFTPRAADEVWREIVGALGLDGLEAGASFATPETAPQLAGTVEHVDPSRRSVIVRTDTPSHSVAWFAVHVMGGQTCVMLARYLYGEGASEAAARDETAWSEWLGTLVPAAAAGEAGQ